MTKKFLLAASALTALVATTATAQSSGYTLVLTNTDALANNAVEAAGFKLANERTWGNTQAYVEFELLPSTSAILPSGNSLLTVNLGTATFGTTVTAASIILEGTCDPTRSVVSGGSSTSSSVQFLLSDLAGCDNSQGIFARIPVRINSSNVTISTVFETEAGTGIDGENASLTDVIRFTSAFSATVSDIDDNETVADVSAVPVYSDLEFGTDSEVGEVDIDVDTTVLKTLYTGTPSAAGAAGTAVSTGDITDVEIDVTADTGSFVGLDVLIDGNAATMDTAETVASFDVVAAISDPDTFVIEITDEAGDDEIEGAQLSVAVKLDLAAPLNDETFSGDINPVTLGGTNFVAPWIAINSTTTDANIRIANGDSEETGPLFLTLTSWTGGTPTQTSCDQTDLSKLSGIAPNDIVQINSADLRTCFGTAVTNADVQVTIQGAEDELTAKARLTRGGVTSEVSLGRLGETGETF
jgi:hypothetical protein